MCILLKLPYAKFDVLGCFVQKLSKKNLWGGGGVGSTPPPLVKEGLNHLLGTDLCWYIFCYYLFLVIFKLR